LANMKLFDLMLSRREKQIRGSQAKTVLKLLEDGHSESLVAAMVGSRVWRVQRIKQRFDQRAQPYALPTPRMQHPYNKYYGKISPMVLAWFLKNNIAERNHLSSRQIAQQIFEDIKVKVSSVTIIKVMKKVLKMKYKKVYRLEPRANRIDSKRKR